MRRKIVDDSSRRGSVFSTLVVMGCTLIARLFGFLKSVVVSAIFGGQGVADVVNAVFSIPNNLRKLLAEGALSTAFIPVINKKLVNNDRVGACELTRKILGLQWIIICPLVLVFMGFHGQIVRIFVDFSGEKEMILSGKFLFSIAPYILIVCLSSVLMAVLNSHDRFFITAILPVCFSLSIGMSVIIFSKSLGIFSIALGVLFGGGVQLLIQYFMCHKLGYQFSPKFSLIDPDIRIIFKTWLPMLLVSIVFFLNQQISVFLASRLTPGSSSALANSIVFFQLPFGVFSASVNTVYYPRITRCVHRNEMVEVMHHLTDGLKLLLVFLVPSSFFLGLLGREIISVAFMRGAFELRHVLLTAKTLTGFCVGMFFIAGYNFLQRYFYAHNNTFQPLLTSLFACVLDVILSLLLIRTDLGVAGLAYANSCAFLICFGVLLGVLNYKYKVIEILPLFVEFSKIVLILVVTFVVYLVLQKHFGTQWWQQGSTWLNFGILTLYACILGSVMLFGYFVLGIRRYPSIESRAKNN